ncbi:restriction endonuclease subunit S [Rhodococcus fascians]|nr:restriction endonuclease subunit S [Rhodococcus fascians]MBY4023888.1 restriction endonuclease subunit S [Rhodococcus fascians]
MNWPELPLRRLARIRNGADHSAVQFDEGEFPVYGSGGVFDRATTFLYSGPAVLMGRKGTIDKPLLAYGKFWTVDTMFCVQPYPFTDVRFLHYATMTIPFSKLSTNTALPSMTQSDLNAVRLPAPPLLDQVRIANYLDRETSKVDALIDKQNQLIATLREDRSATITHTVTKGLNPNVERRDSGVGWIGETVSDWKVAPVRSAMRELNARNEGAADLNYLSLMANVGVIPYAEKGDVGNKKPDDLSKCKVVRPNDFVINSMNYQIGSYGVSSYAGVCSPVYIVLRHDPAVVALRFALRIFEASAFQKYAQSFGNGILEHRRAISWDTLKNLRIPLPSLDEQVAIIDFLDSECSAIDALIAKASKMIATLREYRSALISSAVTGKIDIREVA